jgi:transposase
VICEGQIKLLARAVMDDDRVYGSTELHPSAREAIARIAQASSERGMKLKDFHAILHGAGYQVPARTLRRWKARVANGEPILSPNKHSGRPKALTPSQLQELVGFVLYCNLAKDLVRLPDLERFCEEELKVDVSRPTLTRHMHESGFSSQRVRKKATGWKVSYADMVTVYAKFVRRMHTKVLRGIPACKIASLDFVYTRHSTRSLTSYAPRSGYPLVHVGPVITFSYVLSLFLRICYFRPILYQLV